MKDRELYYTAESDVGEISCDLYDAIIKIEVTEEKALKVCLPASPNVSFGSGEDGVFISQRKYKRLFKKRQQITISIPAHLVPAINVGGGDAALTIGKGIYSDLTVNLQRGSVQLSGCASESAEITGGNLNVKISGCTVKGTLYAKLDCGSLLAEDAFAKRAVLHVKRGNVGLVKANLKECVLEAETGNINAELLGSEQEYSTYVSAKTGTSNCLSQLRENAERSVTAHVGTGNIVLGFETGEKDDAAEDTCALEQLENDAAL